MSDLDASILAAHWQMASGTTWTSGDFNGDGRVNDLDASILAAHWQASEGPTAVPEPAAVAMLSAAVVLAILLRRRAGAAG